MVTYCGVDFHARQQLVKWCNSEEGEIHERQLWHQSKEEVREFYAQFAGRVIVGLETRGYSSWFETMMEQLGHEVWIWSCTEIRRRARARQKTDRRDAELILDLLLKDEFPRIHRLTAERLNVQVTEKQQTISISLMRSCRSQNPKNLFCALYGQGLQLQFHQYFRLRM
jgi:transposase